MVSAFLYTKREGCFSKHWFQNLSAINVSQSQIPLLQVINFGQSLQMVGSKLPLLQEIDNKRIPMNRMNFDCFMMGYKNKGYLCNFSKYMTKIYNSLNINKINELNFV